MNNTGVILPRLWMDLWITFPPGVRKALSRCERAFLERRGERQRQRVVMRKPISAMPRPMARFQFDSPGIGYCMPEM